MQKWTKRLLPVLLAGLLLFGSAALLPAGAAGETETGSIHILNTGWEDAIVLESAGHYALIDAGEPGRGPYIVDYLQRLAGSDAVHLDFIIGTHSHIDHMGGFQYILGHPAVTVGKAYAKREAAPGSRYYQEFAAGCEARGIALALDGLDLLALSLGNMKITLLNGAPLAGGTTNPESLCQLVEIDGYKALLAGDMVSEEKELGVYSQIGGTVDFLKVGHHGMGDSTGRAFARNLRPLAAVYTNGSSWEADSNDVTLGVRKGLSGYNNLKSVGTTQYVTTDNGGVMVVFDEIGMGLRAIREFTQKGEALIYETRAETVLRPVAEPSMTFFERVGAFLQDLYDCVRDWIVLRISELCACWRSIAPCHEKG